MSGRGVQLLPVAVAAFGMLALLKAGGVWAGLSAKANEPTEAGPTVVLSPSSSQSHSENGPTVAQTSPEVERRMLAKLAERRAILDARERELETREALLRATENELRIRLEKFDRERQALNQIKEARETEESRDIDALVSAYEKMKPKDAARIFDALDADVLIPVASGMRTQSLAGVLAEMTPDNARKLTKQLAERGRKTDDAAKGVAQ
ncbi:MAG: hypothetical protein AAGB02_08505 [Pseudomonadota bacterium]